MALWRDRPAWAWRAAGLLLTILLGHSGVRAELLADYFPTGVPGYGTAPGVTVASRARPDLDPPGVRIGSFVLQPQLEQTSGYDDNAFGGGSGDRRGSWVLGTRPSLLVASDWSRHRLGAYVAADDLRYFDAPQQGRTDWTALLGGEVAVGRDKLTLSVAHFGLHQPRTELDALPSDSPVAFRVEDARVSYTMALNRFSVTPSLAFSAYRYDATTILGVPTSQAYRDRNVVQGAVTTRYELSPQRNLLLVTRILGSGYVAPQPGQPTRDSTGFQVLAGLEDDTDAVWRYRLLIGWEQRAFRASQFGTHQAPVAEAAVIWSPSGLTTVTATLARGIEDAAQEGIAGYTYTSARLAVDHEYLRNVLLHAAVRVQHADFLQGGTQANSLTLGVGATWLINRHLRLTGTYDFTDQRGSSNPALQTTGNYTRSITLLALRVAM
ncbi:MAG: outer membrane beta-barrel protein [Acetobacteraceae bacterium]